MLRNSEFQAARSADHTVRKNLQVTTYIALVHYFHQE